MDIVTACDEYMKTQINNYACHVNRASSIGDDCERRLVYERTSWQEKKPYDVSLQYIFELGNILEKPIVDLIQNAGYEIIRQQEPFLYKQNGKTLLSGHIDGIIVKDGEERLLEIKTTSPHMFDSINCVEDLQKKPWTRKYPPQLAMYMLGLEIPNATWIFKNKTTGRLKQIDYSLDYDYAEQIIQKCERINAHVENDTLPDRLTPTFDNAKICEQCPFFHICTPEIKRKDLQLIVDEDLIARVETMQSIEHISKEYDKLKKEIKAQLEGTGVDNAVIGDWRYTNNTRIWAKRWEHIA